jgi:pSer/pThr/pTyr-binding forkhead associated (FHA) protein
VPWLRISPAAGETRLGCVPAPIFTLASVAELEARLQAERAGVPFVMLRDEHGHQRIISLDRDEVVIGRDVDRGIRLDWNPRVSRVHAVLGRVGEAWTLVDDGLSRNGTFVNGKRVVGRRRLAPGDVIRCGGVDIGFCDPGSPKGDNTLMDPEHSSPMPIPPSQRRVLVALCRPLRDAPYAPPATNKAIAGELSLSVDTVKTHLRRLFELLDVDELPQNQKRAQLAWKALTSGLVTSQDLADT